MTATILPEDGLSLTNSVCIYSAERPTAEPANIISLLPDPFLRCFQNLDEDAGNGASCLQATRDEWRMLWRNRIEDSAFNRKLKAFTATSQINMAAWEVLPSFSTMYPEFKRIVEGLNNDLGEHYGAAERFIEDIIVGRRQAKIRHLEESIMSEIFNLETSSDPKESTLSGTENIAPDEEVLPFWERIREWMERAWQKLRVKFYKKLATEMAGIHVPKELGENLPEDADVRLLLDESFPYQDVSRITYDERYFDSLNEQLDFVSSAIVEHKMALPPLSIPAKSWWKNLSIRERERVLFHFVPVSSSKGDFGLTWEQQRFRELFDSNGGNPWDHDWLRECNTLYGQRGNDWLRMQRDAGFERLLKAWGLISFSVEPPGREFMESDSAKSAFVFPFGYCDEVTLILDEASEELFKRGAPVSPTDILGSCIDDGKPLLDPGRGCWTVNMPAGSESFLVLLGPWKDNDREEEPRLAATRHLAEILCNADEMGNHLKNILSRSLDTTSVFQLTRGTSFRSWFSWSWLRCPALNPSLSTFSRGLQQATLSDAPSSARLYGTLVETGLAINQQDVAILQLARGSVLGSWAPLSFVLLLLCTSDALLSFSDLRSSCVWLREDARLLHYPITGGTIDGEGTWSESAVRLLSDHGYLERVALDTFGTKLELDTDRVVAPWSGILDNPERRKQIMRGCDKSEGVPALLCELLNHFSNVPHVIKYSNLFYEFLMARIKARGDKVTADGFGRRLQQNWDFKEVEVEVGSDKTIPTDVDANCSGVPDIRRWYRQQISSIYAKFNNLKITTSKALGLTPIEEEVSEVLSGESSGVKLSLTDFVSIMEFRASGERSGSVVSGMTSMGQDAIEAAYQMVRKTNESLLKKPDLNKLLDEIVMTYEVEGPHAAWQKISAATVQDPNFRPYLQRFTKEGLDLTLAQFLESSNLLTNNAQHLKSFFMEICGGGLQCVANHIVALENKDIDLDAEIRKLSRLMAPEILSDLSDEAKAAAGMVSRSDVHVVCWGCSLVFLLIPQPRRLLSWFMRKLKSKPEPRLGSSLSGTFGSLLKGYKSKDISNTGDPTGDGDEMVPFPRMPRSVKSRPKYLALVSNGAEPDFTVVPSSLHFGSPHVMSPLRAGRGEDMSPIRMFMGTHKDEVLPVVSSGASQRRRSS